MPRAPKFTKQQVLQRKSAISDSRAHQHIAEKLKIDSNRVPDFLSELSTLANRFKLEMLAHTQEHPARIIASIRHVKPSIVKLVSVLSTLPDSVRQQIDPGDLTLLLGKLEQNIKRCENEWSRKNKSAHSHGQKDVKQAFARDIFELLKRFPPNRNSRQVSENTNHRLLRRDVATVFDLLRIRHVDESKNAKEFFGRLMK